MPVNYQQLQPQMVQFAARARHWQQDLDQLLPARIQQLAEAARDPQRLERSIQEAAAVNPGLRCALPAFEPVNGIVPQPQGQSDAIIIAADGSQVNPDRHRQVNFGVINISAVAMQSGSGRAPVIKVESKLIDDEEIQAEGETGSEGYFALLRDVAERRILAQEARGYPQPVITLADGGLELFREPRLTEAYRKNLGEYLQNMRELMQMGALTAGYVDKPGSSLVVGMLEIATRNSPTDSSPVAARLFPDRWLFAKLLLTPGDRSALFRIHSPSGAMFSGPLELHFFYLNVSRSRIPCIVRVEVPGWVASDPPSMALLHANLLHQAWMLGEPYPYVLHRAHEEALVTFADSEQLEEMIRVEMIKQDISLESASQKQRNKDLDRRKGKVSA